MSAESEQRAMFGRTQDELNDEWHRNQGKLGTGPSLMLVSVLSDVQELIEQGSVELARQRINVVKYWMTACCYIKSVEAPADPDVPHLGDIKELIERGVITTRETIDQITAYATDANDLGFRPGNWPSFTVMLEGEKVTFHPVRDAGDGGKVYQGGGNLELYVFND